MGCIESMKYEIILRDASFRECREYIRTNCREYIDVDPGFKIFEKHIIGVPPISIGFEGDVIIFPFTKPCYGTFLMKIEDRDEAERIRRFAVKNTK
ncbi:MAG: DUF1894 domain-containing protein [Methanoregulaceae archaeon]|nr:DUF1894 domain-containing protein [Methanoregulaceae archaeon]MCU0628382.1 DUF1894 domain-containing protein [Methanoregulaceae archaeon]